jgi:phage-related protein
LEPTDKVLVWLAGEVKTPPFSSDARQTAGFLLRLVQQRILLSMPHSRPMPSIGPRCHELRVKDAQQHLAWRIIYRIDDDAVVIGDVFMKKSQQTPLQVVEAARRRFRLYDLAK